MKVTKYTRIRERIAGEQREADHRAAERPPQRRKEGETNRLFEILDDLAVEKLRSENYEEKGSSE